MVAKVTKSTVGEVTNPPGNSKKAASKSTVHRRVVAKPDTIERLTKVAKLRARKHTFAEIGKIMGISIQRAKQLYARSQRLALETFEGALVTPTVRQAVERGGFSSPGELKAAILDGRVKYIGKPFAQSTISGIGQVKFSELCTFFGIDEAMMPHADPAEVRIASLLNAGEPIDQAFAELIGSNTHLRKTLRTVARLTTHLSPEALQRLQKWGATE